MNAIIDRLEAKVNQTIYRAGALSNDKKSTDYKKALVEYSAAETAFRNAIRFGV